MNMAKAKKILIRLAVFFWALTLLIYLAASRQFRVTEVSSDAISPSVVIGEIVDGVTVTQSLVLPADETTGIELLFETYERENRGLLQLALVDSNGMTIVEKRLDVSTIKDGINCPIVFDEPFAMPKGTKVTLVITSLGCDYGNAVSLYCGNNINIGRFDVEKDIAMEEAYTFQGKSGLGSLCVTVNGIESITFYKTYWIIVGSVFALASLLCAYWWKQTVCGKNNPLAAFCMFSIRYNFLLKQLVSREFVKKYKRSVLGVAWSLLNPLLTMSVQYLVFSTLFRRNIPNYPVYLLTGIVFMQFFNNAMSQGMTSITGNAALIKKVYIPKYIYPLSRLISALINFLISFIPLLLVILITGTVLRVSVLLLVFDIFCLFGFVAGMVLLVTTAMTFFQDTQFIWSVLSVVWMYLTPVFYPETIIPTHWINLYHLNPMYQYITFARICIIEGISPEPLSYLQCLLSSIMVLLLGLWVFKRKQDEFILHL